MSVTFYNSNPVPVEYTQEEMKQVIDNYLDDVKIEFSFNYLCSYIVDRAIREGKVANAQNTQYSSNVMNSTSSYLVSKILWDYIWNKKLFIAFGDNPYMGHSHNDTRFIINK